jgi:ABC-type Fe3+ transport system, permease component
MTRRTISVWNLILFVALLIIFLLVVYPMGSIFLASLRDPYTNELTSVNYTSLFTTPFYWRCLKNSLSMGFAAAFFSVVIGVPFAYFTSRFLMPLTTTFRTVATLPLVLPSFISAQAWLLLLGKSGIVTTFLAPVFSLFGMGQPSIYGWHGVVLVFTMSYFPFVVLMVSAAINSVDSSLEEAALNLGSSPWRVFRTVTLPVITPAIASGALMVFCMSVENFGVPSIIGGDYKVISEQAYAEFINEMGGNPSMAGSLSIVLVLITLFFTVLQKGFVERKNYAMSSLRPPIKKELPPLRLWLAWAYCLIVALVALMPFFIVFFAAFTKTSGPVLYYGEFSMDNLAQAIQIAPRPILNSFFLSTVATIIGMLFGVVSSYLIVRKKGLAGYTLDLASMLPLIIAGSVLGIALAATYNSPPVILTGTWGILVMAYFIRKVPFSIKTTSSLLMQIDQSVEEASINLGVPPFRSFLKVVIPTMLPGIIAGAVLMWVTIIAELSSTIVLYYGPWSTMTVQIYQYISSGDFGPASAYGFILIMSVLVPIFLLNRLMGRDFTTSV